MLNRFLLSCAATLALGSVAHADDANPFNGDDIVNPRTITKVWYLGYAVCPYPATQVADGCLAAGNNIFQNPTYFTAPQGGQGPYVTRPAYNVAGVDYTDGPAANTAFVSPNTLTSGKCIYAATGAPTTNGPEVVCGGSGTATLNNIDFGDDGQGGRTCTYLLVNGGGGLSSITYTNVKFIGGSNCNPSGGGAVQVKLNGGTINEVFNHTLVDGCAVVDAYCATAQTNDADFETHNTAGNSTGSYAVFLHVNGRFFSDTQGETNTVDQWSQTYIEGMVYQPNTGHHGEFKEYAANGSTHIVTSAIYSYDTCLQPANAANNQNGSSTTACLYFSDGVATTTFTNVQVDHFSCISNRNGGFVTMSRCVGLEGDTFTNSEIIDSWVDPTGSFYCFFSSGTFTNPTTFAGNVALLTGAAITGYQLTAGVCPGSHS